MDLGKRIMVLGSPGSGKSTIAKHIGGLLDLPVIHLDRLTLLPNWEAIPNVEQVTNEAADGHEWVMDGNYSQTRDYRLERADTVIYLDFNRYICMFRAIKRRIQWHGKSRSDVGEGCPERLSLWFVKWVWGYPKRSRTKTLEWLAKIKPPKQVFVLKGNKAVNRFLSECKK